MRARVLALLLATTVVGLTGCAAASPPPAPSPTVDERAELLSDLRGAVSEVADDQDAADEQLLVALEAIRAVDEAVVALRSPDTLDAAVAAFGDTAATFDRGDVSGLRDALLETATTADRARQTLHDARGRLSDPWEVAYLDAQDDVLKRVRAYAETADKLAQLLERHRPTYAAVRDVVAAFVDRRGNYRDVEEAADALAVDLDPLLGDLGTAQREIAEYRREREEAAADVNTASDHAADVWGERPTDQPTVPDPT